MKKFLFFILIFPALLLGDIIETFYGPLEVTEPVLLELIASPSFQRLKKIHQYGVSYYSGAHNEEYNRFDHSVGVFAILRLKGCPLTEQVAGLLHDVSHTVFSHVGDWIFKKENQKIDYQTSIHVTFLEKTELARILKKHGIEPAAIVPLKKTFPALKNSLPDLCADRIDYNIQGAYFKDYITKEEARKLLDALEYTDGNWVCHDLTLISKVTQFSLFMTKHCWGSPDNYVSSRWLADAILKGVELGLFTNEDIHFNTDDFIWNKLINSKDPFIKQKITALKKIPELITVNPANQPGDIIVRSKFRGIDPHIKHKGKLIKLSEIDGTIKDNFQDVKEEMAAGWSVKFKPHAPHTPFSGDFHKHRLIEAVAQ